MTKKVEKTSLYRVYLRNLFSDTFFKNPDCSVTQTPLPPPFNRISDRHHLQTPLYHRGVSLRPSFEALKSAIIPFPVFESSPYYKRCNIGTDSK